MLAMRIVAVAAYCRATSGSPCRLSDGEDAVFAVDLQGNGKKRYLQYTGTDSYK